MLVVEVPRPFPYESEKEIPWDYNFNYTHQTNVNDLTSVEGITRSDWCYDPGLAKMVAPEKLLVPTNGEKEWSSKEKKGKKKKALENTSKPITKKEASEFLKFIKHSEYSVIEQLNKTPVRISLLSLFQNSKTHCNALLKALGEAYMTPNIFVDGID